MECTVLSACTCVCESMHMQMTKFRYKLVIDLEKVGIKLGNTEILVMRTAIHDILLNTQDFSSVQLPVNI
jgi:hypothetical protein